MLVLSVFKDPAWTWQKNSQYFCEISCGRGEKSKHIPCALMIYMIIPQAQVLSFDLLLI